MAEDLPDVICSAAVGFAIGFLLLSCWRLKGEQMLPRQEKRSVPLKFWVLCTVLFGGMAGMSLAMVDYSHATVFGLAAILYLGGLIRFACVRRSDV